MALINSILALVQSDAAAQVADTVSNVADSAAQALNNAATGDAAPSVVNDLSVWDLTLAGGWLMVPLALLLVVSVYIFFERFFAITSASHEDKSFMDRIKEYIHSGEIDKALELCKKTDSPYSRMIEKGVSRIGRPMNDVLVAIENVGNMEVAKLEKGFS